MRPRVKQGRWRKIVGGIRGTKSNSKGRAKQEIVSQHTQDDRERSKYDDFNCRDVVSLCLIVININGEDQIHAQP